MCNDDSSINDLVEAIDLVPGVLIAVRDRTIESAQGFSIVFTLERTSLGFRALQLLAVSCSEMDHSQRGRVIIKALYSEPAFSDGPMLCFELCGTGEPRHLAAYIRDISRIVTRALEFRG